MQNGDESAYQIELIPIVPDEININGSISTSVLAPGDQLNGNFTINMSKDAPPGRYPIIILTKYYDSNMYPFSTLSKFLFTYKNEVNSDLYGIIPEMEVNEDGSNAKTLTLRNLDDRPHDIEITLYLPIELKGGLNNNNITLEPRGEKNIEIYIESFGALSKSNYAIFASLEYEEQGYHYSTFTNGIVKITEKKITNEKEDNYLLLPLVALFIIILLVYIYFIIGKKKR